jgi:hypothetical protein
MPIPIGCVSLDLGMVPWARYCLTQGSLDAEGSQEIRNAVACTSVPPVLCDDDGDEAAAKRAGDASRQRLLDAAAAGTPLWSGSEALCKAASLWKAAVPAGSKAAMSSTALSSMGLKKTKPNEPCPCGSGKKFKKCCSGKTAAGKSGAGGAAGGETKTMADDADRAVHKAAFRTVTAATAAVRASPSTPYPTAAEALAAVTAATASTVGRASSSAPYPTAAQELARIKAEVVARADPSIPIPTPAEARATIAAAMSGRSDPSTPTPTAAEALAALMALEPPAKAQAETRSGSGSGSESKASDGGAAAASAAADSPPLAVAGPRKSMLFLGPAPPPPVLAAAGGGPSGITMKESDAEMVCLAREFILTKSVSGGSTSPVSICVQVLYLGCTCV